MSREAVLLDIPEPEREDKLIPVMLSDETMESRLENVCREMQVHRYDFLAIYADLEHAGNFEYLTGFAPRFEEAVLLLKKDGSATFLLGNENLKMAQYARIRGKVIHVPYFSLPNQPMEGECELKKVFERSGIKRENKIGIIGWKQFTSRILDNKKIFEVPYYIVNALKEIVGKEKIFNAADLFISSAHGVRIRNNANEIAHYEFGAALSGTNILDAQDAVMLGKSEMEIAGSMKHWGQRNTVVTICAAGDRYQYANYYPTNKRVCIGDKISVSVGYRGGLTCRAGYAAYGSDDLPEAEKDYVDILAKPYWLACVAWLEHICIGMKGGELYALIENVLPQKDFHWFLNPGHLIADEEWLCSPIYDRSSDELKSGMLFQLDLIPLKSGYAGANIECSIALADKELKENIRKEYPEVWERIQRRLKYVREILHIKINEDVLPLSCMTGYYRPYILDKKHAFVVKKEKQSLIERLL